MMKATKLFEQFYKHNLDTEASDLEKEKIRYFEGIWDIEKALTYSVTTFLGAF